MGLVQEILTDWIKDEEKLKRVKVDFYDILDKAPDEVLGLMDALQNGNIDGSTYEGECCCLVGTIANLRNCDYDDLNGIVPDAHRLAEQWFTAIFIEETPNNNPVSKITEGWILEWLENHNERVVLE
jgi:hypothetical protein